jgi:hypothetical protein
LKKPPSGGFFLAGAVLLSKWVFKKIEIHPDCANHELNIRLVHLVFHADLRGAFLCFHAAKSERHFQPS